MDTRTMPKEVCSSCSVADIVLLQAPGSPFPPILRTACFGRSAGDDRIGWYRRQPTLNQPNPSGIADVVAAGVEIKHLYAHDMILEVGNVGNLHMHDAGLDGSFGHQDTGNAR